MVRKTSCILFRHGETDWNAQERFQGHLDIPLNPRGKDQAKNLIEPLLNRGVEALLSSDLSRALETARIISEGRAPPLPLFSDPGLREAHLGEAQGLTRWEIEEKFGEELPVRWRSWQITDADVCYPGGETGNEVIARVFGSLESFILKNPYSCIGIATHGGVIRRIMQTLMPPGTRDQDIAIPNGVIYEIVYDRRSKTWLLP